jgi:hypothetical protein
MEGGGSGSALGGGRGETEACLGRLATLVNAAVAASS